MTDAYYTAVGVFTTNCPISSNPLYTTEGLVFALSSTHEVSYMASSTVHLS